MIDLTKENPNEPESSVNNKDEGATIKITNSMKENLLSATKWIKFLNIMGCISIGLFLLLAIVEFIAVLSNPYQKNAAMAIWIIIIAGVYIVPIVRIFKFIKQARNACFYEDQDDFEAMIESLRYVSRYVGIVTIVVLSLYAILIFIAACLP